MTDKEIIQALRCTSTPGGPTEDCEKCPYQKTEQLTAEQKEKLAVDTWTSCTVTHWMPLPDAPEEGEKHE